MKNDELSKEFILNFEFREVLDYFKHPLGFYYYKLKVVGDTTYRLHIWPEELDERHFVGPHFPIHDHCWSFESLVLVGSIKDHQYNLKKNDLGDWKIFHVNYTEEGSLLKSEGSGRFDLKPGKGTSTKTGEVYSLSEGCFHKSEVFSGFTASLVKSTVRGDSKPRVLGPADSENQYLCSRTIRNEAKAKKYYNKLKIKLR